jgi:5,6-dimethylbenzimidazole synthase
MSHEFPTDWKEGLYQAIFQRRDIRSFRSDPVPKDILARILNAAHHAASVGFMQPWNFILVENIELRRTIHAHVDGERKLAAEKFEGERREKYLAYKLEGILDSPLNICVTCDPTRNGPVVLGRNTIRETDVYSTCCAVQNLWLAARVEGIGVGWVSILEPGRLRAFLNIPEHIIPVAYLCVGYAHEFPTQPTLQTTGWLPRANLAETVFTEKWGGSPPKELGDQLKSQH